MKCIPTFFIETLLLKQGIKCTSYTIILTVYYSCDVIPYKTQVVYLEYTTSNTSYTTCDTLI